MTIRTAVIAIAAIALSAGLSGCGGGESVADACKIAEKEVKDATADLGTIDPTDPAAATANLDAMAKVLKDTQAKIDNKEVSDAIGALASEFEKLKPVLADVQDAGTDVEKLQAASAEMSELSTSIQEKGEKIDQLCN
ncbi:MAG TPA: hypothetical protein PLQ19_06455 [Aeromicrobium sp.]|nr:hypothetical protein [Aeromicrobium sp.]